MTSALVLFAGFVSAGQKPAPKAAAALVAKVHTAAVARDKKALERLMTSDFVSSFGGDGGPTEALALWTSEPVRFQTLARVTASTCELRSTDYVECPRNAGNGFRAGFKLVGSKWVFASFVAGD